MCWWAEFPRFKLLELSVVAHLDAFKVQDHDKLSFDASGMSALLMREIDILCLFLVIRISNWQFKMFLLQGKSMFDS